MDFKKDYFPSAKAPDIARKKIMQYVYSSKKNLSKRFYFYKIYVPAFVLLFVVMGGLAFYNKEIKPNKNIYSFVNEKYEEKENILLDGEETSDVDYNIIIQNPEIDQTIVQEITNNTANDNANIHTDNIENTQENLLAKENNVDGGASIQTKAIANQLQYPENNLETQINEIENLLNDISSITSEEESLF